MKKNAKHIISLLALLLVAFLCMSLANGIQRGHGAIEVTEGYIQAENLENGDIYYKLYSPKTATEENPAPAALLLHGYQNDHETCAAYCIELARRGAVVMAIDEFGHGATKPGMLNRGYVNHKVTVNYGEESKEAGTFVTVGGAQRYRLMMNFSNLSFFDEKYTKDDAGNTLTDSSMGGIDAYAVLAANPAVDPERIAVSGHSMGTWASWTVTAAYAGAKDDEGRDISPKATVLQCGELFRKSVYDSENIYFNNVLLLQAKYDEFSYFRDYQNTVTDELLTSELRTEFLGCSPAEAAWNTTFGSFEEGTARRIELLNTNHRLTTHNRDGLAAALTWFDGAIDLPEELDPQDQVAMTKEVLVLIAMIAAVASILPLMELLLTTKFFSKVAQPLPPKGGIKKKGAWVRGAVITVILAGMSYPFMTQLGHGLLPLPENIFRMTVGNGFVSWYLLLILIMIFTTELNRVKERKKGKVLSYYSMGLGSEERPTHIAWDLMGRSALLTLCMMLFLYLQVLLYDLLFALDLRFIWPFFKTFTWARLGQFCVYILVFALFYLLNNSKIFASLRTAGTYEPGIKGFLRCWWRYALVMVGGTVLIALIEYIPFFMGIGPGADLLFGSTFGGPFMSLLILFGPQVIAFSLICTKIYRRTGSVFTGAFTVAAIACWIVTGGSAML